MDEAAADALHAATDDLVRKTVHELYERHPEWTKRWGQAGREATHRDTAFHFEFLEAALRTGVPDVFTRYTAWLCDILRARNVPIESVEESYDLMADLIERHAPEAGKAAASLLAQAKRATRAAPPRATRAHVEPHERWRDLARALVGGDRARASDIIQTCAQEGVGIDEMGDALVRPAMAEVGRLWQENQLSVAQEHLATAILQTALARAYVPPEPTNEGEAARAVFACVEGNHHTLGLRLVADAFESRGWHVRYLGADVPTRDLLAEIESFEPRIIGLSLSLPRHVATTRRIIADLRSRMGPRAPRVIIGGLFIGDYEDIAVMVGADKHYAAASLGARGEA